MDRLGNTAADNEGVGGGDEGGGSEGGEEPGGVQLAATGLAPPPSNLSTEEMPGRTDSWLKTTAMYGKYGMDTEVHKT